MITERDSSKETEVKGLNTLLLEQYYPKRIIIADIRNLIEKRKTKRKKEDPNFQVHFHSKQP